MKKNLRNIRLSREIHKLIKFLESNPSQNKIEKYYLNKISIYTKDSINDILINRVYDLNLMSRYSEVARILKLINY